MKVGDAVEVSRAFTAEDVAAYRGLGGPGAQDGAVPGPLVGALFSYLLGVRLPGPGTNYLKQSTDYMAPARIGEALTARVEIVRLRPEKQLVDLACACHSADGRLICAGRALVQVGDVTFPQ